MDFNKLKQQISQEQGFLFQESDETKKLVYYQYLKDLVNLYSSGEIEKNLADDETKEESFVNYLNSLLDFLNSKLKMIENAINSAGKDNDITLLDEVGSYIQDLISIAEELKAYPEDEDLDKANELLEEYRKLSEDLYTISQQKEEE